MKQWSSTKQQARFSSRPGTRIHLGGIGKGYAVDRVAGILRRHGLQHFMVQFGGDLYVAGQPGAESWRLGIMDPRGAPGESFALVELRDATLSTSGDYERFFIKDGRRYHHILDPSTGQPARGCRSVSIVQDGDDGRWPFDRRFHSRAACGLGTSRAAARCRGRHRH